MYSLAEGTQTSLWPPCLSTLQKGGGELCLVLNFSRPLLPPRVMLSPKHECNLCYPLPFLVQFNVGALSRKRNNVNNTSLSMLPKESSKVLVLNIYVFLPVMNTELPMFLIQTLKGKKREMRAPHECIFLAEYWKEALWSL